MISEAFREPLDISARIEELKLLKDGWLDGQGVPPSHEGLDWLSEAFDRDYSNDLRDPICSPHRKVMYWPSGR